MECDLASIYAGDNPTNGISHDGMLTWPLEAEVFIVSSAI